jgi:valyl-tRNA synthetase
MEMLQDPYVISSLQSLAKIDPLSSGAKRPAESAVAVFEGGEVYVPLQGLIDKEKERLRLAKNLSQLEQQILRGQAQLENPDFVERAPQEEVQNLRRRIAELQAQAESLRRNLEGLQ